MHEIPQGDIWRIQVPLLNATVRGFRAFQLFPVLYLFFLSILICFHYPSWTEVVTDVGAHWCTCWTGWKCTGSHTFLWDYWDPLLAVIWIIHPFWFKLNRPWFWINSILVFCFFWIRNYQKEFWTSNANNLNLQSKATSWRQKCTTLLFHFGKSCGGEGGSGLGNRTTRQARLHSSWWRTG